MKVVFLDIDGVLNSADLLPDEPALGWEGWKANVFPDLVAKLNRLVEQSGATVVLSSTWRFSFDAQEITQLLQECGATFEVHSRTPPDIKPRVEAIHRWLANHPDDVETWVALDDDVECESLGPRWVQVVDGLDDAAVVAGINALRNIVDS